MADEPLHELTAGYALDALDALEARAYERHLAHCERCRHELAAFSAGATALAFAAPAAEPPAALRERILAAARDDRPKASGFYGRHSRRVVAGLAVAATVAAVGLGIWSIVLQQRLDSSHQALRSVGLHGAAGTVVVGSSRRGTLVLAGLAQPPAGKTYEAWVIDRGKAEPAGTFGGGRTVVVDLRPHVPPGAVVAVTVEPAGGSQQPTTQPFIMSAAV